jgi:hypothetical protein
MGLGINFYELKQLKSYGLLELIPNGFNKDKWALSLRDKTQAHVEKVVAMGVVQILILASARIVL